MSCTNGIYCCHFLHWLQLLNARNHVQIREHIVIYFLTGCIITIVLKYKTLYVSNTELLMLFMIFFMQCLKNLQFQVFPLAKSLGICQGTLICTCVYSVACNFKNIVCSNFFWRINKVTCSYLNYKQIHLLVTLN